MPIQPINTPSGKPRLGESIGNPNTLQRGPPPASPEEEATNASGIKAFITRPEIQAGLLQAGIALLQPIARGQNTLGNVGAAIGSGGQAVGRVLAGQAAGQQQQVENDLAERGVVADETRAAATAEGVNVDRERIAAQAESDRAQIEASRNELESRIRTDVGIAQQGEDNDLLQTITKSIFDAFGKQAENAPFGDGPLPIPPTVEEITKMFLEQRAIRDGKAPPSAAAPLPLLNITDADVADALLDDRDEPLSNSFLDRIPAEQLARVRAASGEVAVPPADTPRTGAGLITGAEDKKQLEVILPDDPLDITAEDWQAILATPWKSAVVRTKYGEATFNALQDRFGGVITEPAPSVSATPVAPSPAERVGALFRSQDPAKRSARERERAAKRAKAEARVRARGEALRRGQ